MINNGILRVPQPPKKNGLVRILYWDHGDSWTLGCFFWVVCVGRSCIGGNHGSSKGRAALGCQTSNCLWAVDRRPERRWNPGLAGSLRIGVVESIKMLKSFLVLKVEVFLWIPASEWFLGIFFFLECAWRPFKNFDRTGSNTHEIEVPHINTHKPLYTTPNHTAYICRYIYIGIHQTYCIGLV